MTDKTLPDSESVRYESAVPGLMLPRRNREYLESLKSELRGYYRTGDMGARAPQELFFNALDSIAALEFDAIDYRRLLRERDARLAKLEEALRRESERIIALETGILEAMKLMESGNEDEAYETLDVVFAMGRRIRRALTETK